MIQTLRVAFLLLLIPSILCSSSGSSIDLETDAILADMQSSPLIDDSKDTFFKKESNYRKDTSDEILRPIHMSPEAALLSFDRDIPYLRQSKRNMGRDAAIKANQNLKMKILSIHRSTAQDLKLAKQTAKKMINKAQKKYADLLFSQEMIIKSLIKKGMQSIQHVLKELEEIKTLAYQYDLKSSQIPPYLESLADKQKRVTAVKAGQVKHGIIALETRMHKAQRDLDKAKVLVRQFLGKARKGYDVNTQLIQNDFKKAKTLTKLRYLGRMQRILDQETLALNMAEANYVKMNHLIFAEYKQLLQVSRLRMRQFLQKNLLDQKRMNTVILASLQKQRHLSNAVTRRRIIRTRKRYSIASHQIALAEAQKLTSIQRRNYAMLHHIQKELKRQMILESRALKSKLDAIAAVKAARHKVTMTVRDINKGYKLHKLDMLEELDALNREAKKAALKVKVSMREAKKGNIYF